MAGGFHPDAEGFILRKAIRDQLNELREALLAVCEAQGLTHMTVIFLMKPASWLFLPMSMPR